MDDLLDSLLADIDDNNTLDSILSDVGSSTNVHNTNTHNTGNTFSPSNSLNESYVAQYDSKTSLLNKRRVGKWIDDSSVTRCYNSKCKETFSYLVRKHHCRLCGRIFCDKCSRYKALIPKDIIDKIPDRPDSYMSMFKTKDNKPKPQRVCYECNVYVNSITSIRKVIKVFDYVGFDLEELLLIRNDECSNAINSVSLSKAFVLGVPDDWKESAEFCIEKFRNLHNKLSTDPYTNTDIRMLWINRKYLINHGEWLTKLLISVAGDINRLERIRSLYKTTRKCSKQICEILYCNSDSHTNIIEIEYITGLIINNNNYPTFDMYITDSIMNTDIDIIKDYLPLFVSKFHNNMFLLDVLLERCRNEYDNTDKVFEYITCMYWCIKTFVHVDGLRSSCIKRCNEYIKTHMDNEFRKRFKIMTSYDKIDDERITHMVESDDPIILPICCTETFQDVDVNNIVTMDSYSRPNIIPFIRENGTIKRIMYKKDDVRKDIVILNIINIMHRLLKEELQIDMECVKYSVMPTTKDTGYIEIVSNASTLYKITETSNIQNYIMEHNDNITIGEIKDRFIKSTALYCVISYLLGFGDRHMENIMISEKGYLFHIDFGYIIGQDPKGSKNKSLRVTPGIINIIGDVNSKNHRMFTDYCTQIYSCLRKHVDIFMNILTIIPNIDETLTHDIIDTEIRDRFEVGESHLQAETHMNMKVRNDSNSFDYVIIDFLHNSKHSKLGKILTSCKDTVASYL